MPQVLDYLANDAIPVLFASFRTKKRTEDLVDLIWFLQRFLARHDAQRVCFFVPMKSYLQLPHFR